MVRFLVSLILVVSVLGSSNRAFAWGKRGHEIVASVAAQLLVEKRGKGFLRSHEFDLGYYANVPDIIWRNMGKDIADKEGPQHYIDWNATFDKVFGTPKNLPLEFAEYKQKMGKDYDFKLGVVTYRIRGLAERCKKLAGGLTLEKQGPLLVCLGVLSHYTGDLSMPLHTTDNHDGQFTNQKGVHTYFEATLVDALDPQLKVEVLEKAREAFEKSETLKMSSDVAVRWLITQSHGKIDELLSIDKGLDRKNIPTAKEKFKSLIVNQLTQGAIITAVVWNEILTGVDHFDENKFYFFDGRPDYLEPGKESHEGKVFARESRNRN